MNPINLLPQDRLLSKRTAKTKQLWVRTLSISLAATLLIIGGLSWLRLTRVHQASAGTQVIDERIAQLTQRQRHLQQTLAGLHAQQNAARFLTDRPDWARLFAVLEHSLDENTVLAGVKLLPTASDHGVPIRYQIPLSGVATAQADVSKLAMTLESLQVFSRIKITSIEQTPGTGMVDFKLVAHLGDAPDPGDRP